MGALLYDLGIRLYSLAIHIAALFNPKAKLWTRGRRQWRKRYAQDWHSINPEKATAIWVHCASLGEFEQGRPVIEALRGQYPAAKLLLTFFSPSGYEIRKNYPHADYVCYLPLDTKANASAFIEVFQPMLAIFVKYEFWRHFLGVLHHRRTPTLLISAVFRPEQIFFQPYGGLFRRLLAQFTYIFVQNTASAELLERLKLQNYSLAGDTRVDRVCQIAAATPNFPIVEAFAQDCQVLIGGSTWPPDEDLLTPFVNNHLPPDWKVIIAPHYIGEAHLQAIEKKLQKKSLRYSRANQFESATAQILLIDNIGMLAALYRYGRIAYIGGGFGAGIHNTLEPIAFGLPVMFGPKHEKFTEAVQLKAQGGAFCVSNTNEFKQVFEFLCDITNYEHASVIARSYIADNQGATEKILQFIAKRKLLHSHTQTPA